MISWFSPDIHFPHNVFPLNSPPSAVKLEWFDLIPSMELSEYPVITFFVLYPRHWSCNFIIRRQMYIYFVDSSSVSRMCPGCWAYAQSISHSRVLLEPLTCMHFVYGPSRCEHITPYADWRGWLSEKSCWKYFRGIYTRTQDRVQAKTLAHSWNVYFGW